MHLSVLPDAPHAGPGVLPHHQELRRTRHLRRGAVSQGVSSCIMHMPAGASCTTPMLNGRDHSNAQCKLVTNACMSHGRAPTGCRARVHRWGSRICGVKTGRPALRCTRISSALAPRGTTPTTRPSFAHLGISGLLIVWGEPLVPALPGHGLSLKEFYFYFSRSCREWQARVSAQVL